MINSNYQITTAERKNTMKTLSPNHSLKTNYTGNELLSISQKCIIHGYETNLTYKLIVTLDNNCLQEFFSENCEYVYSILVIEEHIDRFGYNCNTEFIYDISRSREQAEYITTLLGSNIVHPERVKDIICENI